MSLKRKTPTLCARLSHGMGPIGGYDWPLIAMHAVHLSTGKILVWKDPDSPDPQLWDPATGGITAVPPAQGDDLNVNCSGHVALANGSILLAGGAGSNNEAWIFSLDDRRPASTRPRNLRSQAERVGGPAHAGHRVQNLSLHVRAPGRRHWQRDGLLCRRWYGWG